MALWGKENAVEYEGTISLEYVEPNWVVTGSGTSFGTPGTGETGDVISFLYGDAFLDAVIVGIASTTVLTVLANPGLTTVTGVYSQISELPVYTTQDASKGAQDPSKGLKVVLGLNTSSYYYPLVNPSHEGWSYVSNYIDCHGEIRVKSEVLVAMSGIGTMNV